MTGEEEATFLRARIRELENEVAKLRKALGIASIRKEQRTLASELEKLIAKKPPEDAF